MYHFLLKLFKEKTVIKAVVGFVLISVTSYFQHFGVFCLVSAEIDAGSKVTYYFKYSRVLQEDLIHKYIRHVIILDFCRIPERKHFVYKIQDCLLFKNFYFFSVLSDIFLDFLLTVSIMSDILISEFKIMLEINSEAYLGSLLHFGVS